VRIRPRNIIEDRLTVYRGGARHYEKHALFAQCTFSLIVPCAIVISIVISGLEPDLSASAERPMHSRRGNSNHDNAGSKKPHRSESISNYLCI
jgi:hypothetical protein